MISMYNVQIIIPNRPYNTQYRTSDEKMKCMPKYACNFKPTLFYIFFFKQNKKQTNKMKCRLTFNMLKKLKLNEFLALLLVSVHSIFPTNLQGYSRYLPHSSIACNSLTVS